MRTVIKSIGVLLLLCVSALGIYFANTTVWPFTKDHFYELGKNPGYIPDGEKIRPILLGFDNFVADLYFLRAVQYSGSNSAGFTFNALPDYINLITDLSPNFTFPYIFGAMVYTLNDNTLNDARPLLEKGIRNNPHHPDLARMYTSLAYITYYYFDEKEKAASLYEFCTEKISNCPAYAIRVAASLRLQEGEHGISLKIWMQRHFTNFEEKSDEEFNIEKQKIEEAAKLVALTCATQHYKEKYKKDITSLEDLKGISIYPCAEFSSLSAPEKEYIGQKAEEYGLLTITEETLTSPFSHNPFVWDSKKKRVTGKVWLLREERREKEKKEASQK